MSAPSKSTNKAEDPILLPYKQLAASYLNSYITLIEMRLSKFYHENVFIVTLSSKLQKPTNYSIMFSEEDDITLFKYKYQALQRDTDNGSFTVRQVINRKGTKLELEAYGSYAD